MALSAYKRAIAEKMFVIFRDENQGSATDDVGEHFKPGVTIKGERVPLSPNAKPEIYQILGWIKEGGKNIYLTHLMRNYFVTNWFDWRLKDDETARVRLLKHPFARGGAAGHAPVRCEQNEIGRVSSVSGHFCLFPRSY